jgi:hypothetical protein
MGWIYPYFVWKQSLNTFLSGKAEENLAYLRLDWQLSGRCFVPSSWGVEVRLFEPERKVRYFKMVRDMNVCVCMCVCVRERERFPSLWGTGPLCSPLVPPVISRGAPRQATWETYVVKDGIGREMAGQFGLRYRLPRKMQGLLHAAKEGMLWIFFARKIQRLWPGSNPRSWVPEASILTTRPPKPPFPPLPRC